jgi:chemotaxis protein histidine kinase CheA
VRDPVVQDIIRGFVGEARGLAQKITRAVLALEKPVDPGAAARGYDELCRHLHTLKGSAGTLGFADLTEAAHQMEDAVTQLRSSLLPLPTSVADALLQALDAFTGRVEAYAESDAEEGPDIRAPLLSMAAAVAGMPQAQAGTPAPGEPRDVRGPGDAEWKVGARSVWSLLREVERLRELQLRLSERRRDLEKAVGLLSRLGLGAQTAEARSILMSVSRTLVDDTDEAGEIVEGLEDGVRAITTMPVRTLVEPLHRAVRDLCRHLGKEARLSVVGAELSLDRRMLDSLRGPLIHLILNAVDHGVELPDEREARGKHREASVVVRLEQVGNLAFIEVSDDGRGLARDLLVRTAERLGLLAAGEATRISLHQLQQLIFRPGFSTRQQITETSGRGVGLDVVQTEVNALGGRVEVQSVEGQGTRFTLTLPLELGSSPVLILRCGEHQLGLPMMSVELIKAARAEDLRITRGGMHLLHQDQLLTLSDLGALLGVRQPSATSAGQPVAVVQAQGQRVAVAFDQVLGDRDLVIRPLPRELRSIAAYQGEAIFTRGELVLVLRPDWLVAAALKPPLDVRTRRALVVDDSLTARAIHRSMLEAHGFTVHTAGNGQQALEQLRHTAYDVMICDVGMEGMSGLELTRAVRASPQTRAMPVVLVSGRDADMERMDWLEAGADGYLSKRECAKGRLLSEVQAVIARRRGEA